ncbi:MAG: dimethylsulfoniopropionate demethylase [Proteobacteria bacterium]|nr:dimethylsulfoniopropionate demethylase [Pseudomonadota bacterium]
MSQPLISFSSRLRRTPFSRRVEAAGAKSYNIYNHTILATAYHSIEADYAHLKSAVQVWDVTCQKQVEIIGPDAQRLVQMTTPRDLAKMEDDQCYYIPMVDAQGAMLNDPVLNKLAEDRYWVSLADSDMLYYFKGLANGFGLEVKVFEPDVSPLAVQGPKADELIRRVFGQEIVDTRFFRHKPIIFQGQEMIIARSGWSLQGGFEIYLVGFENGEALWDTLFEAGADLDVHAGCPNLIERIESGLLSYGNDITLDHTPFEVGLGKYCNMDTATGCLGHGALLGKQNPSRQIRPVEIDGDPLSVAPQLWPLKNQSGESAGYISSAVWSPDFHTNVAIGMVNKDDWEPGTRLVVDTPEGTREARVRDEFWN